MFQRKRCVFKSVSLAFVLGLMILFSISRAMGAEDEKPDEPDDFSLYDLCKPGWVSLTWKAVERQVQRIGNR